METDINNLEHLLFVKRIRLDENLKFSKNNYKFSSNETKMENYEKIREQKQKVLKIVQRKKKKPSGIFDLAQSSWDKSYKDALAGLIQPMEKYRESLQLEEEGLEVELRKQRERRQRLENKCEEIAKEFYKDDS